MQRRSNVYSDKFCGCFSLNAALSIGSTSLKARLLGTSCECMLTIGTFHCVSPFPFFYNVIHYKERS